jgi:hypothetical protein
MPGIRSFSSRQRKVHDDNLKAAVAYSRKAAVAAKVYHANMRKIHAHAEKVREAAMGRKLAAHASAADLQNHVILSKLTDHGAAIIKAGSRNLSKAEIRKHHQNLAAIITLMKKNADCANQMRAYLMGIHRSFSRIVKLYS